MEYKHLKFGVYQTTDTFRSVTEHSCVCFDDLGLVAVTGPAELELSQKYAELFAAAPDLLAACEAANKWLDQFGEHAPFPFGGEQELADKLHDAIAKASGGQS